MNLRGVGRGFDEGRDLSEGCDQQRFGRSTEEHKTEIRSGGN